MNKQIEDIILSGSTLSDLSPEDLLKLYEAADITTPIFSAIQSEVLRRIS
jgi:hypothetical protein